MRYVHTNIVAKDWQRLARFYQDVLGCDPVGEERDLSGDWLDAGTGLKNAHIRGQHLRLPGCGESGPTLEIFSYSRMPERPDIGPNTPGITHLAFSVDNVAEVAAAFLAHGGAALGELITKQYPDGRTLVFQYLADPEGNIVELQAWSSDP
ncbi:MAG: VOC family protein [Desulfovibrio sp.]|nr:MAG: VOC family protein [Desulfovibrio sp.]